MAAKGVGKEEIQSKTGAVVALADVSFDVNEGEIFVIMGLSGSGKSTMVRCLNRLLRPSRGSIRVCGREIASATPAELRELRRSEVSMVFQHYGLMPHRNVTDNVRLGLEFRGEDGKRSKKAVNEVLELVGLAGREDAFPRELSGGMQQRVGIARAIAQDTPIMLMDEPFSGLDPLIRREMQDELIRLQADLQKTIVFVTHDLDEAIKVGDRIAVMRDGRIEQMGTPHNVVLEPANDYVAEFTKGVRCEDILTIREVMERPRALARPDYSLRAALIQMRRNDSPVVLVVGNDRKYIGQLTLDQAIASLREGETSVGTCCEIGQFTLSPETSLQEAIAPLLATPHLLPVVDTESGRLVGELHRSAIATLLMYEPQQESEPALEQGKREESPADSLGTVEHEAIKEAVGATLDG